MSSFLIAFVPIAILALTIAGVALRARRKREKRRPVREASAFVVLEGNRWDECTVDDMREPWHRYTTEPVRGFCGVGVGRHRITTRTPVGEATLDFVVCPGEVLAWRLDTELVRWVPYDLDPDTRSLLESNVLTVADGPRAKVPGWMVHLRTTANMASSRSGASLAKSSDDGVERVRKRLVKLVARLDADEDAYPDELLREARALGESLVGKPLQRRDLRTLSSPVRKEAIRLAAKGDTSKAMRVLGLGLALLPGDPELMVTAGCTLAERGETDEALRALNAALERDRCLEAEDVARAMRARMELRARLGRSVRV